MLAALSKPFISELGTDPGCSRAGNDIGRQMTTQQQWEANAVSYTCTLLSAFILADGAERRSNNGGISGFWTPAASEEEHSWVRQRKPHVRRSAKSVWTVTSFRWAGARPPAHDGVSVTSAVNDVLKPHIYECELFDKVFISMKFNIILYYSIFFPLKKCKTFDAKPYVQNFIDQRNRISWCLQKINPATQKDKK